MPSFLKLDDWLHFPHHFIVQGAMFLLFRILFCNKRTRCTRVTDLVGTKADFAIGVLSKTYKSDVLPESVRLALGV